MIPSGYKRSLQLQFPSYVVDTAGTFWIGSLDGSVMVDLFQVGAVFDDVCVRWVSDVL